LKAGRIVGSMDEVPAPSRLFVIVAFGVSIAIGVLVAYFGMRGQIGASIP
jgi:hypothetical protein